MSALRNIGATIAGLVASGIVTWGLQTAMKPMLGLPEPPEPSGFSPEALEDFKDEMMDYIAGMPTSAFLSLILVYLISGFVAGYVATRLATRGAGNRPALVIASLSVVLGLINFYQYPHPIWVIIGTMIVSIAGPILGYYVAAKAFSKNDMAI